MPSGLSPLDFVILGALGLGVWRGLRTGALGQIVGTIGLVVAFWTGTILMQPVGESAVTSLALSDRIAPVVGFVVTFAGVLAALTAATYLLRKTLSALKLGFVDKAAGAVFGGLRAAIGMSVFLLVMNAVPLPIAGALFGDEGESVLAGPVRAIAPTAWDLFSRGAPDLQDQLRGRLQRAADAG